MRDLASRLEREIQTLDTTAAVRTSSDAYQQEECSLRLWSRVTSKGYQRLVTSFWRCSLC